MAIAFVHKLATEAASTSNSSTVSIVTTTTGGAGHFLVGFVANRLSGNFVVLSVSGGGLTWSVDATEIGATLGVSVFSAQIPSGLTSSQTITATLSGSTSRKVMGLYEFSGVATSSPLGLTAVNANTTGNPSVTLGSAATAGDLVFGAFEHNVTGTGRTQTPASGFTSLGSGTAGASSWCEGYAQYKVDTTGTTDVGGYTPSVDTTTSWGGILVTYHETGGVTVKSSLAALGAGS